MGSGSPGPSRTGTPTNQDKGRTAGTEIELHSQATVKTVAFRWSKKGSDQTMVRSGIK